MPLISKLVCCCAAALLLLLVLLYSDSDAQTSDGAGGYYTRLYPGERKKPLMQQSRQAEAAASARRAAMEMQQVPLGTAYRAPRPSEGPAGQLVGVWSITVPGQPGVHILMKVQPDGSYGSYLGDLNRPPLETGFIDVKGDTYSLIALTGVQTGKSDRGTYRLLGTDRMLMNGTFGKGTWTRVPTGGPSSAASAFGALEKSSGNSYQNGGRLPSLPAEVARSTRENRESALSTSNGTMGRPVPGSIFFGEVKPTAQAFSSPPPAPGNYGLTPNLNAPLIPPVNATTALVPPQSSGGSSAYIYPAERRSATPVSNLLRSSTPANAGYGTVPLSGGSMPDPYTYVKPGTGATASNAQANAAPPAVSSTIKPGAVIETTTAMSAGGASINSALTSQADNSSKNRPVADKWALVIGISKFQNPDLNLKCPATDARDFGNFLVKDCHFAADHVRVLTDEHATRANILNDLGDKWLPRVVHPDDLVVVYISTHGSPSDVDLGGINYLVAWDTDPDSLYASGLPMQDLMRLIKGRLRSDRVMMVLDACYSGNVNPQGKGLHRGGNLDVDEIVQGTGQLVISSSEANQVSWECKDGNNSVFTKHLMAALRLKGDKTTLGDAFRSLRERVEDEVQRERGKVQIPVLKSQWEGSELMLAVPASEPRPGL